MESLVGMDWLHEHLNDPNVRIIDCRFSLSDSALGLQSYVTSHIPNALFFDIEKDLSSPVKAHGGRHPLPDMEAFIEKLSAAGIDQEVKVVAYDDQGGMFASRFWWLLRYLGHEKVAVLNGGFSQWVARNYPQETDIPHVAHKQFTAVTKEEMLIEATEIKERLNDDKLILLDSREEKRFRGIEEPVDKVAGHIPGATHFFWKNNIDENGCWKEGRDLLSDLPELKQDSELVVYCGSGITACPNVLALSKAGFTNVKLYAGSWSDWITYSDYPIEKDE